MTLVRSHLGCAAFALLAAPAVAQTPPEIFTFSFEPEAAVRRPSLEIVKDPAASGGAYVWMPKGVATYQLDVPVAGQYRMWGRITAYDESNDSFYMAVDGKDFVWNGMKAGAAWHWDVVRAGLEPGKELTFDFTRGRHTLVVKPRDHNSNRLDTIVVTNDPAFRPSDGAMPRGPSAATLVRGPYATLRVEAESGHVEPPLFVERDRTASGGAYVVMPDADAVFEFTLKRPERVRLWGRVIATPLHEDSFAIRFDGGPWIDWHLDAGTDWHWSALNEHAPTDAERVGQPPRIITLRAGRHRLELNQREHGAKLDRILLTNDLELVPGKTLAKTAR